MAIDDNKSYGLKGSQIKDIANQVEGAKGIAKVLTSADYNWNSTTHNTTEPYDSVALWLLPAGIYRFNTGVSGYIGYNGSTQVWFNTSEKPLYMVTPRGTYGVLIVRWETDHLQGGSPFHVASTYSVTPVTQNITNIGNISLPIDALDSNNAKVALSAHQGNVLNGKIGDLTTLTTNNKGSIVAAINEVNQENSYSTSYELNTEKTWIDGKTIYKKSISVAALPNASSQAYSFGGGTTVDSVVRFEIIAHDSVSGDFIQIPDGVGASAKISGGNIDVTTTADYSGYSADMTVWYTKTVS